MVMQCVVCSHGDAVCVPMVMQCLCVPMAMQCCICSHGDAVCSHGDAVHVH